MKKTTLFSKTVFTLSLILFSILGFSQTTITDTTPGGTENFIVPAGVTSITVEVWGGGGRGGYRPTATNAGGCGGGGGAYSRSVIAVTPGASISYYVGAGSTSPFDGNTPANGEDTWFSSNTTVMAKGGVSVNTSGSSAGAGGNATQGYGTVKFDGGKGSAGSSGAYGGGGGSSSGTAVKGVNATNASGAIAPTGGGNGGDGRSTTEGIGLPGVSPGGGGGGSYRANGVVPNGGFGANGQVVISYTTSSLSEINVLGNATSIVDGDTTPTATDHTEFSTTSVGVGTTRTYTITNTGTSILNIGAISFTGTNSSEFTVTTLPAATVAVSGNTTFVVTFTPTGFGTRTATLSMINDDGNENPYTFALQGNVNSPEIDIQGNAVSIVDGDTTPTTADHTDFGSTSVGVGITRTFTIYNTGSALLTLSLPITVGGTHAANFAVTTPPAATVAAGGSTTFIVTFTPSAYGVRTATLSLTNDDPSGSENPYNFSIQGTANSPEIDIRGNAVSITDDDLTPSLTDHTDFGSTNVGVGITRTFTIHNTGTVNLVLGARTLSNAEFVVTTAPTSPVVPGGSTNFIVTFTPTTSGIRTSTISIVNDDADENPFLFTMQGTGNGGEIEIQGNSTTIADGYNGFSFANWTDFGPAAVLASLTRTYTILNTGQAPLNITGVTFSGGNTGDFSSTTPSTPLAAGASTTFTVTFTPQAAGIRTTEVRVTSDDSNEATYDFDIRGTGGAPEINVKNNTTDVADGDAGPIFPDWTNFGDGIIGVPVTKTYLVQNIGTGTLNITGINFSGGSAGDYSVIGATTATIAPGQYATFDVAFTATTTGTRSTTIQILNNDSNEGTYDFAITGNGVNQNTGGEITVQGNSTTIPDGNTTFSTYDYTLYGNNYVGTPTTRTYYIYNTGLANLTISSITSSGARFTVSAPVSSTIVPGGSTTFVVTYSPNAVATDNSTITVNNNDADAEGTYTFDIRGAGIAAPGNQEIEVNGNGVLIPDEDITPSLVDWTIIGDTFIGTPITKTFTIKNVGTANLTITSIADTGGNTGDFSQSVAATPIVSGSSTTFTVTFNPTALGTRTTTIRITNNDSNEGTFNFDVKGTGIASPGAVPEIAVEGNFISISNGDITPSTTDATDFGTGQIVSNAQTKTYTIRNYGGGDLNLTGSPLVSVSPSTDFTVVTQPTTPVTSIGTTTFVVQFSPTTTGTKTAVVSITNNDSNEGTYEFTVQGIGIQSFYDSDGDTVYDNLDKDDDNDGTEDNIEDQDCEDAYGLTSNYKYLYENFGTGTTRVPIPATYSASSTYCFDDGSLTATPTLECPQLGSDNGWNNLNDGEYTVASSAQNIASFAPNIWHKGGDHTPGDTDGRMAIFNAAYDSNTFYTAKVTGIIPDLPFAFRFWCINLDRTDALNIGSRLRPNIRVEFRDLNDVVLYTYNTGPLPPTDANNLAGTWVQHSANLTLGLDVFKVVFFNNETGGSGNDLAIDDIEISQTLCDTDLDNIPNIYDLDSDNDGIEDAVEAGFGYLTSGKGIVDVSFTDLIPSGGNGMHDPAESLLRLDSDNDGIPNYIDLDSDNDSVFDVDEGPGNTVDLTFTNGDGDVTGDGKGDGLDTETYRNSDPDGNGIVDPSEQFGDGILDLYDKSPGVYGNLNHGASNANPNTTYLKDTDGDGIPDYLDVMSNGTTFDIANNKLIYDYKVLDANNNGILDSTTDLDYDGIMDNFDTNSFDVSSITVTTANNPFGSPRDLRTKFFLDFDGRNDYAQDIAVLDGVTEGSLMSWIDLNSAFSGAGFVVGQDDFQIRVTAGRYLEAHVNGTTVTSPTVLGMQRWYHAAATYDGATLNLYLNGTIVATAAATGAISDTSLLTIGRSPSASTNFFKGKIDEVRVFNVGLTEDQVQRMAYQEIDPLSPNLTGTYLNDKEIGQDLTTSPAGALTFTNLLRYYRMDIYKDDIIDDLTTPTEDVTTGATIYNHKNIHIQQAPMPFVTIADGDLATAVTDASKDIQGTDVNNYHTIVNVKHDNTTTVSRTDVGLVVDAGKSLTVNGDAGLTNKWWLKLDGEIDLVGRSQLVQNSTSDLDPTSAGFIERDQQGQSNLYNYNYWSSPVNPINNTTNNTNYTVDGVMKDGTTPSNPQNITWTDDYDGNPSTPITLSRYWLYKFESAGDAYANWIQFLETDALRVGQGYTLKGSGAGTATQNLVYVGKPNNGSIDSNVVTPDELLLVGNPYPSALDADEFINDNNPSINAGTGNGDVGMDGTLYFWEHASDNSSHVLADYLGGYAVYNLSGGIAPVVPDYIDGVGASAKVPQQYIPVGQGFFVYGLSGGSGPVLFDNSQRAFIKEDNAASTTLFRTKATTKVPKVMDDESLVEVKKYKKIRLGYNNNENYHRQVLLAFMEDKATAGIDYGYDAEIMDDFPNDMYFLNGENQLVIQGEGHFDINAIYPLGLNVRTGGKVSFAIDALENFDPEQPIFIHDNLTNTYHDIRKNKFEVDLPIVPSSKINKRFSLRFFDKTLSVAENALDENAIQVAHIQKGNVLEISNQLVDITVEKITLFNLLGQSLSSWKVENQDQQNILIPLKNSSTGVYIVKIKTSKGELSKKLIIK